MNKKIYLDLRRYLVPQKCKACGKQTDMLMGGVCHDCYKAEQEKRKQEARP